MKKIITAVANGYTITNSDLARSTVKIQQLTGTIRSNYYRIGLELIHIRDEKLYETANEPELQTFMGYCENALCLSRATTYRIIATTEKIFLPLQKDHGDILNLPDVALYKMCALETPSTVIDFVKKKNITADLTVREVERRLTEYQLENENEHIYAEGILEEGIPTLEKHDLEVQKAEEKAREIKKDMEANPGSYPSEDNLDTINNEFKEKRDQLRESTMKYAVACFICYLNEARDQVGLKDKWAELSQACELAKSNMFSTELSKD